MRFSPGSPAGFASHELPIALVLLVVVAVAIRLVAGWLGVPFFSWLTWLGLSVVLPVVLLVLTGLARHGRESRELPAPAPGKEQWIRRSPVAIESDGKRDRLELNHVVDPEELSGGDRLLVASLETGGYSGIVREAHFAGPQIARFLRELSELEASRRGAAALSSAGFQESSSGLRFELRAIDHLGHMAIRAELKDSVPAGEARGHDAVQATFPIEPSRLPALSRELCGLLSG